MDKIGNFGRTITLSNEFKTTMKQTEKPESQYDYDVLQLQEHRVEHPLLGCFRIRVRFLESEASY